MNHGEEEKKLNIKEGTTKNTAKYRKNNQKINKTAFCVVRVNKFQLTNERQKFIFVNI